MAPITKTCALSGQSFTITDEDQAFYKKMGVPHPTLSPEERHRRRSVFRNERSLYKRKCMKSGQAMISVYSEDKPYTVFHKDIWWGNDWDPLDYGRDFDFSRPFFEQYNELLRSVPHLNMMISHCENSDYSPYCWRCKNAYMCASGVESEDIYYCYQANNSTDCIDCSLCDACELCYECIYGVNLFQCFWTENCKDSSELYFCRDLQNCSQCIGCTNLRNQKLHIFNKPVTQEQYTNFLAQLSDWDSIEQLRAEFEKFSLSQPFRENHNINCEDISGDHLISCKNAHECFESTNLEDCSYVNTLPNGAKDCYDIQYSPKAELCYESLSAVSNYNCICSVHSWDVKDSAYIFECYYSDHLFGCSGIKNKKFCILNKQYSRDDYQELVAKIKKHMKETGEWGQFFPANLTPFAYNETLANDLYPLTQSDASQRGYFWKEEESPQYAASEDIATCKVTNKPFRLISQELDFYKRLNLPSPTKCPNQRFKERMQKRLPHRLWKRSCAKTGKEIWSSYSPDRPEIVYSEEAYLKELY